MVNHSAVYRVPSWPYILWGISSNHESNDRKLPYTFLTDITIWNVNIWYLYILYGVFNNVLETFRHSINKIYCYIVVYFIFKMIKCNKSYTVLHIVCHSEFKYMNPNIYTNVYSYMNMHLCVCTRQNWLLSKLYVDNVIYLRLPTSNQTREISNHLTENSWMPINRIAHPLQHTQS